LISNLILNYPLSLLQISNIVPASTQNKKILIVDDLHPTFAQAAEKLGYTCTIDASFTREKTLKNR